MDGGVVNQDSRSLAPFWVEANQLLDEVEHEEREGERGVLAMVDGEEGSLLAGDGSYHRYLREPQCVRNKHSLPLPHPAECPLVRGHNDTLAHVDDLAFRLEELNVFGGGHLAIQQVLVVVVVLPDDTHLAVAHAELLPEVLPEVGRRQLDTMLGLQSIEQIGQLQWRLALLDKIRDQPGDPFVYLEMGPFFIARLCPPSLL
jgi:hypothetical protein